MGNEVAIFKLLPFIVMMVCLVLSCVAGFLVYSGLSSNSERIQTRIRIRNSLVKNRNKLIKGTLDTKAEEWLKKAQYPLGLNGMKYYLFSGSLIFFLLIYYVMFPMFTNGGSTKGTFVSAILIIILAFLLVPSNPFSLFVYLMKRVMEFHQAKKNAEVFMLYDLLINEIEMMTTSRINTYNMIRNIKPYFVVLDQSITMLLSTWSSDEGPKVALDKFSKEFHSKEADALIGVIKNLDDLDRSTALGHLRGMHNMFVKSQIENYRRKKKITTDLLGIPIKTTHFIIILNFLAVIVTMVSIILSKTHM